MSYSTYVLLKPIQEYIPLVYLCVSRSVLRASIHFLSKSRKSPESLSTSISDNFLNISWKTFEVDFKGDAPVNGSTVTVNDEGVVTEAKLGFSEIYGYYVNYDGSKAEVGDPKEAIEDSASNS